MRTVDAKNRWELVQDVRAQFDLQALPTEALGYLDTLAAMVDDARKAAGSPVAYVTSWVRDSGVHATGAAVDFALADRDRTFQAWSYLGANRRGELGEVIYEQPSSGITGHVHLTLPGFGGRGQVLYQNDDGGFVAVDPFSLGTSGAPIPIPGLTVTVGRDGASWWPWAVGLGIVFLLARGRKR